MTNIVAQRLHVPSVVVATNADVFIARQRARQIASLLALPSSEQAALATAVSEIARNVIQHAGTGTVHFSIDLQSLPHFLWVCVKDSGPGPPDASPR